MCPDKILLSRYHDGDLDDAEKASLLEHVSGCRDCGAYVRELDEQSLWLAGLDTSVPAFLEERIRDRVLHGRTAWTRVPLIPPGNLIPLAAAASVLFLLLAGFVLLGPSARDQQRNPSFRLTVGNDRKAAETQESVDEVLASMQRAGFFDEVEMDIPMEMGDSDYGKPELVKLASADGGY
jgi:anti-sigma factor RsiW